MHGTRACHPRQTLDTRAAQKPHQDGIGLIVPGMGEKHMGQIAPPRADQIAARLSRGILQIALPVPLPAQCCMRMTKCRAFGGHHRGLIGRGGAQPMIDCHDMQTNPHDPRPAMRKRQHRHAVAPARNGKTDRRRKIRAEKRAHARGKARFERVGCHVQFSRLRTAIASDAAGLAGKRAPTSPKVRQASSR